MKNEAKNRIEELTDRFRRNVDVYKNGAYNETQVRREFIDPFFEALGWDVANRAGYAEQYKDVVHEDSIKVGVSLKAPEMVSLVDRMLDLNKKLQTVKIAHDRELLERQIKITDDQIDRLVYELYGLTEEEIGVVES